jgi:hypothetical protein
MVLVAQGALLTAEGGTPIPFFTQRFLAPCSRMDPYAHAAWALHRGSKNRKLLVFYIVFVAIGEAITYAAGRTVELWSRQQVCRYSSAASSSCCGPPGGSP